MSLKKGMTSYTVWPSVTHFGDDRFRCFSFAQRKSRVNEGNRTTCQSNSLSFACCCLYCTTSLVHSSSPTVPSALNCNFLWRQDKPNSMSFHETSSRSYMAPRTAARIAREVQELLKSPETGVRLIVDEATGMPASLQEITVRVCVSPWWLGINPYATLIRWVPGSKHKTTNQKMVVVGRAWFEHPNRRVLMFCLLLSGLVWLYCLCCCLVWLSL